VPVAALPVAAGDAPALVVAAVVAAVVASLVAALVAAVVAAVVAAGDSAADAAGDVAGDPAGDAAGDAAPVVPVVVVPPVLLPHAARIGTSRASKSNHAKLRRWTIYAPLPPLAPTPSRDNMATLTTYWLAQRGRVDRIRSVTSNIYTSMLGSIVSYAAHSPVIGSAPALVIGSIGDRDGM